MDGFCFSEGGFRATVFVTALVNFVKEQECYVLIQNLSVENKTPYLHVCIKLCYILPPSVNLSLLHTLKYSTELSILSISCCIISLSVIVGSMVLKKTGTCFYIRSTIYISFSSSTGVGEYSDDAWNKPVRCIPVSGTNCKFVSYDENVETPTILALSCVMRHTS